MNIKLFSHKIKNYINLYKYKVNQELFKSIYPEIKYGSYDSTHYLCGFFLRKLNNRRMLYEFFSNSKSLDRRKYHFLNVGNIFIGIGLLFLYSIFVYVYLQNIKFNTTLIILIIGLLILFIYLKVERLLICMFLSDILLNNSIETRQNTYQKFLSDMASNDAAIEKNKISKRIGLSEKSIKNNIKKRL